MPNMRNLSEKTQQHYIYDLERWFIYILDNQQNRSIKELTDEDIMEFLYFCKSEGNNAERIKGILATISAMYRYLRKKRQIQENPCEFIDRPKKGAAITQQTYLTPEQVALMRERLISSDNLQLRVYAMLSLSTMARVTAIASIRWDMIDLENKIIKGVLEKEGKIVDDTRIVGALKTINHCLEQNAKVILLSHLGRVKEEADLAKNDLAPVAVRLEELLGKKVTFINKTRGEELEKWR